MFLCFSSKYVGSVDSEYQVHPLKQHSSESDEPAVKSQSPKSSNICAKGNLLILGEKLNTYSQDHLTKENSKTGDKDSTRNNDSGSNYNFTTPYLIICTLICFQGNEQ
jgi:hypothetical protein